MIYIQKISSFETEATAGPTIIEEEKKRETRRTVKGIGTFTCRS